MTDLAIDKNQICIIRNPLNSTPPPPFTFLTKMYSTPLLATHQQALHVLPFILANSYK